MSDTDGDGERARDVLKVFKLPAWFKKKENAAERRAVAARTPAWLVGAPFLLGALAGLGEALFMVLFVVRAVGDIEWSFEWVAGNRDGVIPLFDWSLHMQLHPLLFGMLFFASLVIIAWSIVWIPIFLALAGQGRWVRLTVIGTGLFCNGLVLAGGFHGQNTNRLEDVRTEVVASRELESAVNAAVSRFDAVQLDLRELLGPEDAARPSIQMQACRAGAERWAGVARRAAAEANPNAGVIERAIEVAGRCDDLRSDRAEAQAAVNEARAAAAAAVTVRDVGGEVSGGANEASEWIDEWRPFGISLGLSLIAIFSAWIGVKVAEARALYVEPEAKPAASEPGPATTGGEPQPDTDTQAGQDGLHLPPLPDPALCSDPDFERLGPMDEHGRRLRRVAGHFRPEQPAKPSKTDARRAPDEPIADPDKPSEPAASGGADGDDVNLDDIIARATAKATGADA